MFSLVQRRLREIFAVKTAYFASFINICRFETGCLLWHFHTSNFVGTKMKLSNYKCLFKIKNNWTPNKRMDLTNVWICSLKSFKRFRNEKSYSIHRILKFNIGRGRGWESASELWILSKAHSNPNFVQNSNQFHLSLIGFVFLTYWKSRNPKPVLSALLAVSFTTITHEQI